MTPGTSKHRVFKRERDFLDFACSYLSEAFPNPERKGCPPDHALKALANRPMGTDLSISDHLTSCSPCFDTYMAYLAHARADAVRSRKNARAAWIRHPHFAIGMVIVLLVAIYGFLPKRHSEPAGARRTAPIVKPTTHAQLPASATYIPISVDLSNASPARGVNENETRPSPQVIPSESLIDLRVLLPLGSADRRYLVELNSNQHVIWSGSPQAHLEDGQTLLYMHADFTHVPPGHYDLVVVAKGFRVIAPVLLKSGLSGSLQ